MKQTIIASVALVVLIVGGYYAYQQGVNPRIIDFGTTTATMMSTTSTTLADGTYAVDTTKSTATWEGSKKILVNWIDRGSIKISAGSVAVASSTLSSTVITFDMQTITASETGRGNEATTSLQLVKHLKSDAFFNVEKYPTAVFKATGLKVQPGVEQTITGDLTIRDVTKSISLPILVTQEDGMIVVSGKAVVDRTGFNVKFGSSKFFDSLGDNVVNDEFKLDFKVYFKRAV